MLKDTKRETAFYPRISNDEILSLVSGNHRDPHRVLGLHPTGDGAKIVRVFRPGASYLYIQALGRTVEMTQEHPAGVFTYRLPAEAGAKDYRIYHHNGLLGHDPYALNPTFTQVDQYLFLGGVHYELYRKMGARLMEHEGMEGVSFVVWAPNAWQVSVVGQFNHWDGRQNPMRVLGDSGIWELFIPGLREGELYKFSIKTRDGRTILKADPYALAAEMRPATASRVTNANSFRWTDQEWIERRKQGHALKRPMNIYELHLGSWKKNGSQWLNYREIAKELVSYCKKMAFTHVELMPISEHPLDESWGYQVTGFYAVTSRYGSVEDFQFFVNELHKNGIGVFLDWVPGHFPVDDFGLRCFDGTHLYEHADPRQGMHPHWGTCIFNYSRKEVSNFLIANALFWMDLMHIDGLRVDAVASMLYLNYGREDIEWVPNEYGGSENIAAIEFCKHLNSIVHQRHPGILMIAEESSTFPGVTHSVSNGGLGFDLKWNMGWMNDTLEYMATDPLFRKFEHEKLTFGQLYAYTENFVSVLSHDEVVHGKASLLAKMPGDEWRKFANLRLLYSYMLCQPGKQLLFMGGELGQWTEWNEHRECEWSLLQYPKHKALHYMIQKINHFYLQHPALWERDHEAGGFEWVHCDDRDNSVLTYQRKGFKEKLLCVHNFTPQYHPEYYLPLAEVKKLELLFSTDSLEFEGSGKGENTVRMHKDENGKICGVSIEVAPLSTMIFDLT
ncbi:MAG: 1,4-alpha-glucan branching enzyme [Waddliaceae bacterium]|nr:1,4-alpha-glucan branching enzyme [Waddliaceae bacterium]